MHSTSYDNMRRFVDEFLAARRGRPITVLDIGSQDVNGTYKPLLDDPKWRYSGADMAEGANVDIVLKDVYHWREIPTGSYDVVISGQALEHIEFPWMTMLEVERVLRPGGVCCIIAPSSGFEHRYPLDCFRFYRDGMNALARYADLRVEKVFTDREPLDSDGAPNLWYDTVLIATKPADRPFLEKATLAWRRTWSRWVLPPAIELPTEPDDPGQPVDAS